MDNIIQLIRTLMGQLEDLRAFVQIAEHQSIGKAAESMGIAKSAMSRKLRLLEERMQTELIVRTTRQWALTESGRQLYERGVGVLTAVDELDDKVRNESSELKGEIRISVPLYFGKAVLSNPLLTFAKDHPAVHLKVDFSDRIVDVVRENYDFVVRIANLPDSSLIARKLCETQHVYCASKEYLASHPPINHLHDMRHHKVIQFGPSQRFKWTAKSPAGKLESVSLTASLNSDDGAFLIEAAEKGIGVTRVPDFMAEAALQCGSLVRVLEQFPPDPRGIYAVYPTTKYLPARTRALLDYIVGEMSQNKLED